MAGELDVCPYDLITEYTKLNANRAVQLLSTWERFPVELVKVVAIQRSRPVRPHAVLPGPDKHSRPHSPKTTAIFKAFTATYKKFAAA